MELNPNHRATQAAHDNWHKIAALLMFKIGVKSMIISVDDVKRAFDTQLNIAVQFDDTIGIKLLLVTEEEAVLLAKREGGLPV